MSQLREIIRNGWRQLSAVARSSRGKDSLIFLLFLCVSYVFWLLLTLNDETQEDIDVHFELTDVPDGTTIISDVPGMISASVRDKGTTLIRFVWGAPPTLKVKFRELTVEGGDRLVLSDAELSGRLRNIFGPTSRVLTVKPDSLNIYYTSRPGRRLPVTLDIDATPSFQSVISGPMVPSVDSVTVYSVKRLPSGTKSVATQPTTLTGLTDTTRVEVPLVPIPQARTVPDRITVKIPVEPLIAKRRIVPVKVIGAPSDIEVHTFPAHVAISFLVPMSMYSLDDTGGFAVADYMTGRKSDNITKMPLTLTNLPEYYHNVSSEVDSVEYLISAKEQ